ncbi:hypothetical protein NG895_17240 [Aeoliella sp. ICT_H6.2]|uniref:Carboxypeptidase regulatory-like domain-containing protein n=1 Tax=Aeoliella straminimaris TaxID=2954799 RepID=A0A9X2FB54_9BACT|nr:hypothetical protein [Aeoliella straminimaris]MCO6045645.1 hypothetical protein [Aeoliella straminimaris]
MRILLFATAFVLCSLTAPAVALITGSDGDEPVDNPGWPVGAAEAFNVRQRIAYWVGPPFGGGQYHGEFRGDTAALNEVLDIFGDIRNDNKRIVVEEGTAPSGWLRLRDRSKEPVQCDWKLMVWDAASWKQLSGMRAGLDPTDPADRAKGPPTVLTIYTGGNIEWDQVKLPEGVEVVDNRLSAHGFTEQDGYVCQGQLIDLESDQPIAGKLVVELMEAPKTGGYKYTQAMEVDTEDDGNWTIKNVPDGRYRLIAESEGYVPRVVGHVSHEGSAKWREFACRLAKPVEFAGRVVANGKPAADVNVRLIGITPEGGRRYESTHQFDAKSDAQGTFRIEVPPGKGVVGLFKEGLVRPGLAPEVTVPSEPVDWEMTGSAQVTVIVIFETTEVPKQYMVELEPEGGNKVGSWGGSATIDEKNQCVFKNVPPGRYYLVGHPNPYSEDEKTDAVLLDLKGGDKVLNTITVSQ